MMSDFESETREDGCGVVGEMISESESKTRAGKDGCAWRG